MPEPTEQDLVRALEAALARDPHFSPVCEISLERGPPLGEGGMAVVHLVTDRRLGRQAALKVAKTGSDESRVRRFLREARITARLDHPGIPPVTTRAGPRPESTSSSSATCRASRSRR